MLKPSKSIWTFCLVLIVIGFVGPLAIDMYVPAMPAEAKALMVSATDMKLSLSLYIAVSVVALLFYGTLSDCYGRKKILLLGLAVGTIGSILCVLAPHIGLFYAGRIAQGLGYSAIPAVIPAIGRDLFEGKRLAQVGSILSLAFGIGPILSPVLGAHINHSFGWRMIFVVLGIYTVFAIFIMSVFIPETHPRKHRNIFRFMPIIRTYAHILKNPVFLKNAFSKAVGFMCFFIFYTITPFMLQNHLHLSVIEYGWISVIIASTILLSKALNTWFLVFIDINTLVLMSLWTVLFAGVLMLVFAILGYYSVNAIVIPFVIMGFACGFLFSNTTVAVFYSFKGKSSGSVAGLLNGVQLFAAFAGSAIAAHLATDRLLPLALLMTAVGLFSVGQYLWFSRR